MTKFPSPRVNMVFFCFQDPPGSFGLPLIQVLPLLCRPVSVQLTRVVPMAGPGHSYDSHDSIQALLCALVGLLPVGLVPLW